MVYLEWTFHGWTTRGLPPLTSIVSSKRHYQNCNTMIVNVKIHRHHIIHHEFTNTRTYNNVLLLKCWVHMFLSSSFILSLQLLYEELQMCE